MLELIQPRRNGHLRRDGSTEGEANGVMAAGERRHLLANDRRRVANHQAPRHSRDGILRSERASRRLSDAPACASPGTNRSEPSIDAPVALFFGAGTLYNRDDREYLVKAFPGAHPV